MSSTNLPPDPSTAMSTLTISAPDNPSANPPRRRVAPHRRYAKKFLTLPNELLTNISDNVAPEDLPNFRLICKTFANIAAKRFGQTRLAHRRFIFTEYSLTGLIDMTAHPVFGPCIKSIMFGDGHVTEDLMEVIDALKLHNITNDTEAMQVLRKYCEHWRRTSRFLKHHDLSRMLRAAFHNLRRRGTEVCVGIYSQIYIRQTELDEQSLEDGYGSSHDHAGLPFVRLALRPYATLRCILDSCSRTNFHPRMFVFDLNDQEYSKGVQAALDLILPGDGRVQSLASEDICIIHETVDIRILSNSDLVEFVRGSTIDEVSDRAEDCYLDLDWLEKPMLDALLAASITRFRMKTCSMNREGLVQVLEAFAGTLQVVEMIDVVIWDDEDHDNSIFPLLYFLRDDLRLQKLVLDDLRAWETEYGPFPLKTVAKGRSWNGQQQIVAGLNVLLDFGPCGWDSHDGGEEKLKIEEKRVQSIAYSQYEHTMDYARYLEYKARREKHLEDQRRSYADDKARRAEAKEAMARVEAGNFST